MGSQGRKDTAYGGAERLYREPSTRRCRAMADLGSVQWVRDVVENVTMVEWARP